MQNNALKAFPILIAFLTATTLMMMILHNIQSAMCQAHGCDAPKLSSQEDT